MGSRLRLQRGVAVEPGPQGPVLRRHGVAVAHRLQVGEALALEALDALGEPQQARLFVSECIAPLDSNQLFDHVLKRWAPYLEQQLEDTTRELRLGWLVNSPAFVAAQSSREPAPAALTWLVTLGCNRRCPYCFYDVFHHAADAADDPVDASLSTARARTLVEEMAAVGAADLYLTGGEPLLRRDLIEIMEHANQLRVRTHLTTKFLVDGALAGRLVRAGVHRITLSLDDARAPVAAALAGVRGYLDEARQSLRAMVEAGLPVEVNCVVTARNRDGLHLLAQMLIDLGVPKLTLGTYSAPTWRRGALRLVPEGLATRTAIARLLSAFGAQLQIESSGSAIPEERPCGQTQACDVGFSALDVLPDGRVTRCRYLPGREDLVVGDLRKQTLMEIWDGAALGALTDPERDSYAGTACHDCSGHSGCNTRGRCYYTAIERNGVLHGPDAFCERTP